MKGRDRVPCGARFFTKMKNSRKRYFGLIGIIFTVCFLLSRPYLLFVADHAVILAMPVEENEEFTIRFIHSVQKTPVEETLRIDDTLRGFVLMSTKYQSFGVGLPFLAEEGTFRKEGDYFIFDDMDRHFSTLALRSGVGTELTIIHRGEAYPLYRRVKNGEKIELRIEPYYKRVFIEFEGEKG